MSSSKNMMRMPVVAVLLATSSMLAVMLGVKGKRKKRWRCLFSAEIIYPPQ
jgi:hypothetical protein